MESADLCECSVGISLQEECHLRLLSRKVGLNVIADLSEKDRYLLEWRCGTTFTDTDCTICFHHMMTYISNYESQQRKCADPFSTHPKQVKSKLIRSYFKIQL